MARGLQAQQAQAKNKAKQDKLKKQAGGADGRAAALKMVCPACLSPMTNYPCLKQHYEARHPKLPVPTEDECAAK